MNITVAGSGYVGLVVGACFAETGHTVQCADVDAAKIEGLLHNQLPIYEPGLDALVERNQREKRLSFTTDVAGAIGRADAVFIAVGTPPDEDGSADLRHVLDVAEMIGCHMRREIVIGIKSTVPVGTSVKVADVVARHALHPFHVCSNPEFLKEGDAVANFMKPDRVIVGAESDHARSTMAELYAPFVRNGRPLIFMDVASAELTKYAANAMLATRITFMNEMARLCEETGANIDMVRRGIGSDDRIGPAFLYSGPGYGGSCFPKDVKAIARTAREYGAPLRIIQAVEIANERQKHRVFENLEMAFDGDLKGRCIAVWGLSFKANTDDMRESPALALIEELLAAGAHVVVHDPVAMGEGRRRLGDRVSFADSSYEAVGGADALAVMTEWPSYRHPDLDRLRAALRHPVIVDGRNLYDPAKMARLGFRYFSIGRPTPAVVPAAATVRQFPTLSPALSPALAVARRAHPVASPLLASTLTGLPVSPPASEMAVTA